MAKKAVLWDMDGTLVDSEHMHIQALAEAMTHHDLTVPEDLYLLATGMSAENVYAWLQKDFGLAEAFDTWLRLKYGNYMRLVKEIAAFPDALALWNELAKAGVPQAIVSNSDRLLVDTNLKSLDLTAPRMVTVSRNDVRKGKPDPESYLRAAWLLDVQPEDAIVLEDSPTGAKAGVAAGMTAFLVPSSPSKAPNGVTKLSSFDEIAELFGLAAVAGEPV